MPELARAAIALPIIFAVAGLLLLVHELGHYIAARACGRLVRLIAIGFGPKLIERVDRRGTTWRLALVPIGGYVALHADTTQADQLSFRFGPVLVRPACHRRWSSCQPDPLRHPLRRPRWGSRRDRLYAGRQLHRTREPGRKSGFPAGR